MSSDELNFEQKAALSPVSDEALGKEEEEQGDVDASTLASSSCISVPSASIEESPAEPEEKASADSPIAEVGGHV